MPEEDHPTLRVVRGGSPLPNEAHLTIAAVAEVWPVERRPRCT
jgi:hypothetical protein